MGRGVAKEGGFGMSGKDDSDAARGVTMPRDIDCGIAREGGAA